ncbi:MobA/MobL family protein [Xanthomonas citri]|uniref:MobA/MobL family protein n=1 Tax=Xanthomonas citri TaxID=346 RepID=UPI001CC06B18|nr:MobA/MobL family protein [Xanthomonas citri]MBZ3929096.1 plasmid mobilization protein [Xanthomonas citri pv. thirumalacharii]
MAIYRVEVKSGKKGTCVEHSRYDARSGKKYEDREDLLAFEFDNLPEWSQGKPQDFWKAADKYERSNAAAYREWIVVLPNELDEKKNLDLSRKIAKAIAGDRPWQLAMHRPEGKLSGEPNPHVHVMTSDRAPDGIPRPAEQYFCRYNPTHPEKGGCRKLSGGKTRQQMREDLIAVRKKIADLENEALAEAGVDARVDYRSLRDQGIDRHPGKHLGPARVKRITRGERKD